MTANLDGQVAVVTGAARGIGKAIALDLARLGCDIVIAARTETPRRTIPGTLGETAAAIEALGRRALRIRADLSEQGDIERVFQGTMSAFGQCDILINNAALTDRLVFASLADVDRAGLERYLTVNLVAPFALTKLFAEEMRKRGSGAIVNITSGAANIVDMSTPSSGREEGIVYGTSKAGLNRMTNAIARELQPLGIPCIAVDPGATRTEVWDIVASRDPKNPIPGGHPVEWPARVVSYLLTCPDPMAYSGQVIVTESFVHEKGLA